MDNENNINDYNKAQPDSPEVSNTEEVINLTEETTEKAEEILNLSEVDTVNDTDTFEITASEEEKSEENNSPNDNDKKTEQVKKKRFYILGNIVLWLVTVSIFLSVFLITGYYVTTASKSEFHADCTDTIMWANASVESGHLYDQDFKYACFLPIGTSTIMTPLIHFFGLSIKTHIIGMTIFFILFTLFIVLMMREVSGSLHSALIGTSLFLSLTLITPKMREIFWGHTIYYSLGLFFLAIGTFMYFRILSLDSKAKSLRKNGESSKSKTIRKFIVLVLMCAFMLLTGMDGVTGLTLFTIPITGAIFAEQFLNTKQKFLGTRSLIILSRVIIFLVMAVVGVIINNECIGKLVAGYQDANTEFSSMDTWTEHLHSLPLSWMKLLGVTNLPDVMFTDEEGIYNLIYIMSSIIIAVIPVIATCCYKKFGNGLKGRMLRIWIWIHWAVSAVNLTGFIFGLLSAADWRIIPMLGSAIIVSILFILWAVSESPDMSRISILLMIPVIAAGILSCVNITEIKKDDYKNNTQYQLAEFLESEGVTKGYSTFWNANSITVITGEKVKVRDIYVDENGARRRTYQSAARWYNDDPLQQEYFLLVDENELNKLSDSSFFLDHEPVRQAETVVNEITYTIFVFDHNFV